MLQYLICIFNLYKEVKRPPGAFCPMGWAFYLIGGAKRPFLCENKNVIFFLNIDN